MPTFTFKEADRIIKANWITLLDVERKQLEKELVKRLVTYELLQRILHNTPLVKDNSVLRFIIQLEEDVEDHIDKIKDILDAN
jgi:hypothetical protein